MAPRRNKGQVLILQYYFWIVAIIDIFITHADANEIQQFVNVALATDVGGEGDLSHDKLSHLRTVGSGFASLVYLPKYAGFNELKVACACIWDALEKEPNLPQLLVSQYKISILLGIHFNEHPLSCLVSA